MAGRLKVLGILFMVIGLFFLGGAAYAYTIYQNGGESLNKFSAAQNVELSYNDEGQLIDRGSTEGADTILKLLKEDWGYPVKDSELDPQDPLVNTASEYMYQMATIAHHVLDGTQTVTLTEADLTGEDGKVATEYTCNGETVAVPTPFPADGVTCEFKVGGRYYTGFDRTDPVQGPARDQAWSGTVMALFGELGVGAVTASTLQLAGGVVLLIGGLGLVNILLGAGLFWTAAAARKDETTA